MYRAKDLRYSCLSDLSECRCFDAERRLESGEISCYDGPLVEQCPEGCEVCERCLGEVLADYCDGMPSASPSSFPTPVHSSTPTTFPTSRPSLTPTSLPSPSPTSLPTNIHSAAPTTGPTIDDFDLDICETYENDW